MKPSMLPKTTSYVITPLNCNLGAWETVLLLHFFLNYPKKRKGTWSLGNVIEKVSLGKVLLLQPFPVYHISKGKV